MHANADVQVRLAEAEDAPGVEGETLDELNVRIMRCVRKRIEDDDTRRTGSGPSPSPATSLSPARERGGVSRRVRAVGDSYHFACVTRRVSFHPIHWRHIFLCSCTSFHSRSIFATENSLSLLFCSWMRPEDGCARSIPGSACADGSTG